MDTRTPSLESADLDVLTRHIVDRHHRYVREASARVTQWLGDLALRHPEVRAVALTFDRLAAELMTHMFKEENILFPFVDELAAAAREGRSLPRGPFGTILHPIRVMESEHLVATDLIDRLRVLTLGFEAPAGAGDALRRCYAELARFDADLRQHIHLEDRVLFPRALELERALT